MRRMTRHRHAPVQRASLRIIAGQWRGRRIPLSDEAPVRPTGDRIRETLFNWLTPVIRGARCLDLFAGTGALGLEALSRGAAAVAFVEHDSKLAASLERTLQRFGTDGGTVHCMDALRYLRSVPQPFDVVFLDPPFDSGDLENLCKLLDQGWLAPGARVYLEMSRDRAFPVLPPGWSVLRDKKAGKVRYALATTTFANAADDRDKEETDADRGDVSGHV